MQLELIEFTEKDSIVKKVDEFIKQSTTNGEFINTIKYLSYHPSERFKNDFVAVIDKGSQTVKGVMLAAASSDEDNGMISHPGTTFSGPILDYRLSPKTAKEILDLEFGYFENKYKKIEIKMRPSIYDSQFMEFIQYYLLNRGFSFEMTGLANVINLKGINSEEELLNRYSAKRRNEVRKVFKEKKFYIKNCMSIEEQIWENMCENLRGRYKTNPTHSFNEIKKIIELFPQNISFYVAEKDNKEYGAFGLIYKFKNVFHTQYLDLNYAYSSEYPNLYLIHNLILKAKEEGYDYFSFGASTENRGAQLNESLFTFKADFGGGSIILPSLIWADK